MQLVMWYNLHMQPISKTRSIRATDEEWEKLDEVAKRRGFRSRNALILSLLDSEVVEPKRAVSEPVRVVPKAPPEPEYDEDDWEVVSEDEWDEIEREPVFD